MLDDIKKTLWDAAEYKHLVLTPGRYVGAELVALIRKKLGGLGYGF